MKIGFTGTRDGITTKQFILLLNIIQEIEKDYGKISEFHHGDCVGADTEAHDTIEKWFPEIKIYIHPPRNPLYRGMGVGFFTYKTKNYLERNKDIVNETDLLIVCPKSNNEELKSGTWATVRYARKLNKKIIILYPQPDEKKEDGQ